MGWTDERIDSLKKLWLDGLSASQIAKHLGGVSRNAVIGKVHRLGLTGRAAPSQPTRAVARPTRPTRPVRPVVQSVSKVRGDGQPVAPRQNPNPPASKVPAWVEEPGTATVLTLGAHMCKWPIGDPETANFTFCGRRSGGDGPYCVEHARIAYQPAQAKKKSSVNDLARGLRRYI